MRLNEIDSEEHAFVTIYQGQKLKVEQLKKMAPIEESIFLKRDCLVMLRQNDPKQRWVKSTRLFVNPSKPSAAPCTWRGEKTPTISTRAEWWPDSPILRWPQTGSVPPRGSSVAAGTSAAACSWPTSKPILAL